MAKQSYREPSPLYVKKSVVEDFAQEVAKTLQFQYTDDLFAFVERIGGKISVGTTGNEDTTSGSILINKNMRFQIFISPFTSIERDRFTIAHELGHLFLHYPKVRDQMTDDEVFRATRYVDLTNQNQQVAEREANWFAAALLMPKDDFTKVYQEHGKRQAEIEFNMSTAAVRIRAQSLGL